MQPSPGPSGRELTSLEKKQGCLVRSRARSGVTAEGERYYDDESLRPLARVPFLSALGLVAQRFSSRQRSEAAPASGQSMKPASGVVGTVVTIKGSGFMKATAVAFNGTAASTFTVDSDKQDHGDGRRRHDEAAGHGDDPPTTLTSRKDFGVLVKVSLAACSGAGGNRNLPAGRIRSSRPGGSCPASTF